MNAKIQKWLEDNHPLHFADWKKGEYSRVILCTFEDWEKGKAKVHEAPGVKVERLFDEDGQNSSLTLHALPPEEYEKISKQKKRLADGYITHQMKWWKGAFRMGCIASKEPEWYLEQEIKRVTEALEDPEKGFFNSITGYQLIIGATYSETSDKAHPDDKGKTFNNELAYYHYHTWKAPAKGLRYWDDLNLSRYREWQEHGRQPNTVSMGCDAHVLAQYREHLKEWKENPPFGRWELIREIIKETVKQHPGTEMFADEKSVNRVHLPLMEREYKTKHYPSFQNRYSDEAFRREISEQFDKWEKEIIEAYSEYAKSDKTIPNGLIIDYPRDKEWEATKERDTYMYKLLVNTLRIEFLKQIFTDALNIEAKGLPVKKKRTEVMTEPEPLPAFEDLFFHKANADKVRRLLDTDVGNWQSICFAMAVVIKDKELSRPQFTTKQLAKVLARDILKREYPKKFTAYKYRKTDVYLDSKVAFDDKL